MQQNFKGLSNIGATCYMNSLLQTLFMTPEFKQAIYDWKYNERLHPKPADSILYQMQKLFAKLDQNFPGEVSTKQLVKSFQWQDEDAQMQQDIQEFNRVLFEALQKSLINKKNSQQEQVHFLRDLYEGQMVHYTHCRDCQNESQREESFQDLILTVKNPFEKVYNNCIELAIQRYMKPEILDQDNMYFCDKCQKKVSAERGVRFLKMPKLLNVIIRRFDFDYFTFQRVKLNDRVEFPHVLNMNNYMNGYQNINDKLNEESSAYFIESEAPRKKTTVSTNPKKIVTKKSSLAVAGKVTTKPSVNTKSFLAEMRKKKGQSSQDLNQDLLYVSGHAEIRQQQTSREETSTNVSNQIKQNQIPSQKISSQTQKTQSSQITKPASQLKQQQGIPLPPSLDILPPEISKPFKDTSNNNETVEDQLAKKIQNAKLSEQEKELRLEQQRKKSKEAIERYRQEGNLVYELYAVLVHNGSATHGHYYSYIKSIQNDKWFCFNDQRVTEINVVDIEKTFGGIGHSNAYALSYRQVEDKKQNERTIQIPKYIEQCIAEQVANIKKRERQKVQNIENIMILKIYHQLSVKVLEINKSSTMQTCLKQARQMFDIPTDVHTYNLRLRMFNPISQTKLQTYGGKEGLSLEQLKISSYKNLLLEIKNENEVFEEYVVGKINIRVAFWEECKGNIKSLDESFLTLHKVSINKGSIMKDVEKAIQEKRKEILNLAVSEDNICIVKRHQNDEYSYHEIINLFDYKQKSIDQLMVMENQILFVEPDSNQLMWPEEFDNEVYRITIKYVNAETGKADSYLTDYRKSIGELKILLCALLGLEPEETIIRRGSKSGMELKNYSSSMKQLRFISGTQVHLQKGLPAKQGEVRVQLYLASDAPQHSYNRLHEFEFIADVPVNGLHKASEVKEIFAKVLKKYKDIDLEPSEFRIREKVLEKIGKIYREKPMKQQQLIEKREIAIQRKPQGIDNKEFKDFLIYVRIWDPQNWTLSPKLEINVDKNTTMKMLASIICKQSQELIEQEMEICRILSLNKFNILDLCEMEYYDMSEASVFGEPLFVNADGLVFVAKNKIKQIRNLTQQQEIKFGGNIKPNFKSKPRTTAPCKKEKGVTIKVIENNEDNQDNQLEKTKQQQKTD